MNDAINYLITSGNILNDTGSCKIFYDFTSYTGDSNPFYVNSVVNGQNKYTGQISTYVRTGNINGPIDSGSFSKFIATGFLDNNNNIVTGKFMFFGGLKTGLLSGNPSYGVAKIDILNYNELFTGNNGTFILEGGIIPRDWNYSGEWMGTQIPYHDKEVIFSNFTGTGFTSNGWEFGLNGANKLYFSTNDGGAKKTLTLNNNTNGENLFSVRLSNNIVNLTRFVPEESGIDSVSKVFNSNINGLGQWTLGKDKITGVNTLRTGICNNEGSSIWLSKFLYFDEYLTDSSLLNSFIALRGDLEVDAIVENQYIITGTYEETGTFTITGNYYEVMVSGGIISTTGTQQFTTVTPLSGLIISGDSYLQQCEDPLSSGIFYTDISLTSQTGITGYSTGTYTVNIVNNQVYYIPSGVTGANITGQIITIYETGIITGVTGYTYNITAGINNAEFYSLYPKTMSYIGPTFEEDFIEHQNVYSPNTIAPSYHKFKQILNRSSYKGFSSVYVGETLFLGNTGNVLISGGNITGLSSYNFYFNGQAQRLGTGQITTTYISGDPVISVNLSKDFIATGFNNEIIIETGILQSLGEDKWGIYDFIINHTGIRGSQVVDTTGYFQTGGVFNNDIYDATIRADWDGPEENLFFNGIKIYEDIHWVREDVDGGAVFVQPILEGLTGIYFTLPRPYASESITGYASGMSIYGNAVSGRESYNIHVSGKDRWSYFEPNSVIVYINGMRQSIDNFIYHDKMVDMINGSSVSNIDSGTGDFNGVFSI